MAKSVTDRVLVDTLCALLSEGYSENAACGKAGLHPVTYSRWMQRGYNDLEQETPYADFYSQVSAAKGEAENNQINKVLAAKDWKAAAWHLERRFAESWGDVRKVQMEGKTISPEDIDSLRKLSTEEIEKMLQTGDTSALAELPDVVDVESRDVTYRGN